MTAKRSEQKSKSARIYTVNKHPRQLTLKEAMRIVKDGVSSIFEPTEKEAIALCICALYKRCYEANKKYRKGMKTGYTDQEYDAMERSLMVYCSDYDSLR